MKFEHEQHHHGLVVDLAFSDVSINGPKVPGSNPVPRIYLCGVGDVPTALGNRVVGHLVT